jgi:hypothetical protein
MFRTISVHHQEQLYKLYIYIYPSSLAVTNVVLTFNVYFLRPLETLIKFYITTKYLICSGLRFVSRTMKITQLKLPTINMFIWSGLQHYLRILLTLDNKYCVTYCTSVLHLYYFTQKWRRRICLYGARIY